MKAWTGPNTTALSVARAVAAGGSLPDTEPLWPPRNHSHLGLHAGDINSSLAENEELDSSSVLQFYYEQLLQHPLIIMRDDLWKYITPILMVFGNLSNLLVLVVVRGRAMRQHSVCVYMTAYACANLLVLNLILGMTWLCYIIEKPYINALTDSSCRLWTFVSNVMIYCGIWFVVVLSIDRFIYLCYAHKATTFCTLFAAKTITIMVVIGLIVVSIHAMWTYELQPQGCFVSFEEDLHTKIWPLWSATVYSYLPLTLLLFINIVLSISLCLKRHRQRQAQTVNGGSALGDDFVISTLVISSAFFLLAMPATVINVVDIYFPMSWLHVDLIAEIELTKKITEVLSSANQTLLGVILLVFSRAFRQELFSLVHRLRLKRRPKVYEMGTVSTSELGGGGPTVSATTSNGTNGQQGAAAASSRNHIEYEVCNSSDITTV